MFPGRAELSIANKFDTNAVPMNGSTNQILPLCRCERALTILTGLSVHCLSNVPLSTAKLNMLKLFITACFV